MSTTSERDELNESLTNIDWLPRVSVGNCDGKPPCSYATLITYALQNAPSPEFKMTLQEIYEWIQSNYPYFQTAEKGWKNSVRHNLSLNKSFKKILRKAHEQGKGSFWTLNRDTLASKKGTAHGSSSSSSSVSTSSLSPTSAKRKQQPTNGEPVHKKKNTSTGGTSAPKFLSTTIANARRQSVATAEEALGHVPLSLSLDLTTAGKGGLTALDAAVRAGDVGKDKVQGFQGGAKKTPGPSLQARHGVGTDDMGGLLGNSIGLLASFSTPHLSLDSASSTDLGLLSSNIPAYQDLAASFSQVFEFPSLAEISGPDSMQATPAKNKDASAKLPVQQKTPQSQSQSPKKEGQQQPPVITLETISGVMADIESNEALQTSVNPQIYKRTQDLLASVRADMSVGNNSANWLLSPHFSNLAASFNELVQPNNILSQIDVANIPVLNTNTTMANMFDVEDEEEEFDWSTIT